MVYGPVSHSSGKYRTVNWLRSGTALEAPDLGSLPTVSTTQTPPRESYECTACGDDYPAGSAYAGSYCSDVCYHQHKGRDVIRDIKQDQRWCATCFRPVKEIEQPPSTKTLFVEGPRGRDDETLQKDVLIGHQHPTEQTRWVVDEQEMPNAFLPLERSRWGCSCGAVNPSTQSAILQRIHAKTVITSLLTCLAQLHDEGNVAHHPSREALFDALRERPFDWAYAAGRAIYTD